MSRRVVLFVMAVATLGLAAPAMASAAPVLTMPATTLVPLGTGITATSSDWALTEKGRSFPCEKNVELRGRVGTNSTANGVLLESAGVATTDHCGWRGANFFLFEDMTLHELVIKESGKGTATLSFTIAAGESGCTWTAKNAPFTYTAGTSTIKFNAVTMEPLPLICASNVLDADFTLETTAPGSGPILID
jgi:hypothetical protein